MQCVHEGLGGVLVDGGVVVDMAIETVAKAPWSERRPWMDGEEGLTVCGHTVEG